MKDFMVLRFLDIFKVFFEKLGIDYKAMRRILQIKLIMDGRRVPTLMNSSKKKEKADKNQFRIALLIYALLGLVLVPFIIMGDNYIFQMGLVFGLMIFMLMSSLISDFSSVLLDLRDKNIVFSKPVHGKTLNMAKFIHISIYMISLTFSFTGVGLIAALLSHGVLFFIIFLVEIILVDLFIVVITALIYLLILRFFDGEKLKDIINYVQIILSISIAVGYQLLIRLFSFVDYKVTFVARWWQYLIFPIWFGAPFEVLLKHNNNINIIIFSILALIVPVISIIIYIKLTPVFERNLLKLENNSVNTKKSSIRLTDRISNLICSSKIEKTFFRFSCNMMKNERGFKLKVYPSLGFSIVFPFIFIFNELKERGFNGLASSRMYLAIYMCALMLPAVITMMKYSDKYKGAWIYKTVPFKETSDIYRGTIKAFIVKLIGPIFLLESLIFIAIFGIRIFPDIILVFLNMMIYMIICFRTFSKAMPFSEPYGAAQQSEGLIILPIMLIIGVLALIHCFTISIKYGVYFYILIALIINVALWKRAFKVTL